MMIWILTPIYLIIMIQKVALSLGFFNAPHSSTINISGRESTEAFLMWYKIILQLHNKSIIVTLGFKMVAIILIL
jgi:hypothetical protein